MLCKEKAFGYVNRVSIKVLHDDDWLKPFFFVKLHRIKGLDWFDAIRSDLF